MNRGRQAEHLLEEALKWQEAGDTSGALRAVGRAVSLDSGLSRARFLRGCLWLQRGNPASAIQEFDAAIALEPQPNAKAYSNRGVAHQAVGDIERALQDFTQAIVLEPSFLSPVFNRGYLLLKSGLAAAAHTDFDAVIAIDPDDGQAWTYRGRARYEEGDVDGALADYEQALSIDPGNVTAYRYRARVRYDFEDEEGAILDLNAAIALDPANVLAYFQRGLCWITLQGYEAAISDFSRTVSIDPAFLEAYYERAKARYAQNDLEGTALDLEETLRVAPPGWENRLAVEQSLERVRMLLAEPGELRVRVQKTKGSPSVFVVRLGGRLSGEEAVTRLAAKLDKLCDLGHPLTVLDLAGLTSLGSRGAALLVKYADLFRSKGGRLALVKPPENVKALLVDLGLEVFFDVSKTVKAAIREVKRRSGQHPVPGI